MILKAIFWINKNFIEKLRMCHIIEIWAMFRVAVVKSVLLGKTNLTRIKVCIILTVKERNLCYLVIG